MSKLFNLQFLSSLSFFTVVLYIFSLLKIEQNHSIEQRGFVCIADAIICGGQVWSSQHVGWIITGIGVGAPRLPISNETPSHADDKSQMTVFHDGIIFSIMWNNIFRTFYALAGAYSAIKGCNTNTKAGNLLVLLHDAKMPQFGFLVERVLGVRPQLLSDTPGPILVRNLVVGTDKNMLVEELQEDPNVFSSNAKGKSNYLEIANSLRHRSAMQKKTTANIVIVKRSHTRILLNQEDIVKEFQSINSINLTVVAFENLGFDETIDLISATDILVAVHGAALSNMILLQPGSFILELFPHYFHKDIYRNFAKILDLNYISLQSSEIKGSIELQSGALAKNILGQTRSLEESILIPFDWRNRTLRNIFRDQNIMMDINLLTQSVNLALDVLRGNTLRFLMIIPENQSSVARQVFSICDGCQIAKMLNRTLILPFLLVDGKERLIDVEDYFQIAYVHGCSAMARRNGDYMTNRRIDLILYKSSVSLPDTASFGYEAGVKQSFTSIDNVHLNSPVIGLTSSILRRLAKLTALSRLNCPFTTKTQMLEIAQEILALYPHISCINFEFPESGVEGLRMPSAREAYKATATNFTYWGLYHDPTGFLESNKILNGRKFHPNLSEIGLFALDIAVCSNSLEYIGSYISPISNIIAMNRIENKLTSTLL